MVRRLRKHPQHHPDEGPVQESHGSRKRFPFGLLWLVLTIVVLAVVLLYDRRGIHTAREHIETATEFQSKGLYQDALNEYEAAFENKRLGRKDKAGVAVSMAEINFNHMENYTEAHRLYVLARKISSSSMDDKAVQEHAKAAAIRAEHSSTFKTSKKTSDGDTTQTIVQRVELLSKPAPDLRGPVVATYKGGELYAGEVLRALQKRPEFLRADFREDPARLKNFIDSILRENLAYEAAVSAGVLKDPDVSQRLYDYQKSLVTQRYTVDRREQAMVVDNADVDKYYKEHISEYVQPGRIRVSVIKADSETTAAELLKLLRDGVRFEEVATSHPADGSIRGGDLGYVTEKDTVLQGIGEAPKVIDALFKMPAYSVTEVTPINGAWYIFKIVEMERCQRYFGG